MRGAEAILEKKSFLGKPCVLKKRIAKKYRVKKLDEKLRMERTRSEARLLHKAKLAGVLCPTVLEVDDFRITMSFVSGERPKMTKKQCKDAGELLAKLHLKEIIHGDYTPANLILEKKLFVIDFGLGFVSNDVEDKAVDVFTMMRALGDKGAKEAFISGYRNPKVLGRVKEVEKRVRYAV